MLHLPLMHHERPLDGWLKQDMHGDSTHRPTKKEQAALSRVLAELSKRYRAKLTVERSDSEEAFFHLNQAYQGCTKSHLPALESFYGLVAERGGPGSHLVRGSLLYVMGYMSTPDEVPFWRGLLEVSNAKDKFTKTQQFMATAALTRLASLHGDEGAFAALREAATGKVATLRTNVVELLVEHAALSGRSLPPPAGELLTQVASRERTLKTRLFARSALSELDLPIPDADAEARVVARCVPKHFGPLTIEIELASSRHTLHDLHEAIQAGLEWDDDHLYLFSVGSPRQRSHSLSFIDPRAEDTDSPSASAMTIGELGLRRRDKLTYVFDFGDHHLFDVTITSLEPDAPEPLHARVVSVEGTPPSQYPEWDA